MERPLGGILRALLDTNILIALTHETEQTPQLAQFETVDVSIITWTELTTGLHAARDLTTYKSRHRSLASLRQVFGPGLPFDEDCHRAFDSVLEASVRAGAQAKSSRMDKMIAATALAHDLVLVTRNPGDFKHLTDLIHVVEA